MGSYFMEVFGSIDKMQKWCLEQKRQGKKIGLVPTMGYLHEGHLALVREAVKKCDTVVVSIFVNPVQFCPGEDFAEYPRDLNRDCALLEKEKVHAVFAPSIEEMYPRGYGTYVEVQGEITQKMCGASRPGHFRGVTTVVSKLFNICQPDTAFFGQKDAQQVMVIEKMVRELNFPLEIIRVPIVREEDGLAMSSRNVYLDEDLRREALVLSQALKLAEEEIANGERDVESIREKMKKFIEERPRAEIDYIAVYNGNDLSDLAKIEGRVLIALAVKFGKIRLIDNLLVEV